MYYYTFVIRWMAAGLATALALAYNPPVDTAGPLTARIDGPAVITRTGEPVAVSVTLENKGDAPLAGTLRMGVIDDWQIQPERTAFALGPQETARFDFTVTAGEASYNAHYPIHAFAETGGLTAHPVLLVETRLPNPPRAQPPVPWNAVDVAPDSGLALWRLPVRRAVIQVFDQPARTTATAWEGTDPDTRASVQFGASITRGTARETIAIHPPWAQGKAGTLLLEYPLALPAGPLRLRFGMAVRDPNPGARGDGVTFRVRAVPLDAPEGTPGDVLFERHTDAKTWEDADVDLTRLAERSVRLQLESHPGPNRNTSFDQSYWAEPTLVAGYPPAPENGPWVTLSGNIRVRAGARGLLDATVALGKLEFHGFRARVLGDALEDWRSPTVFLGVVEEMAGAGRMRLRHRFRNWAGAFDLLGELSVESGALRARFWLENVPEPRPWLAVYLEDLSVGAWNRHAARVYAGPGNVLDEPEAFRLSFDGHRLSTSFAGFDFDGISLVEGVDAPPAYLEVTPASSLYTLHAPHPQTLTFIPAANVWDAVKTWRDLNGLKAAGGVARLAGRFVFDLWGGQYEPSAASLAQAFRYGLTDSVVVWHNWQRWGYDYRLPDIYPPNPQLGTAEAFRVLAGICDRHGVIFAPHDNYIDFYPDAEGFSYGHIAFNAAGAPVKAWFNKSRAAQSYRWRADSLRPFVERNLALIRDGIAPTGYFIDVWSSAGPYDYWTADGRFFDRLGTRAVEGGVFAWIRDFLGGAPTISESGHDQLIGYLDGAQTNHLRVAAGETGTVWPIRCADAERIPWFDAAHHDRFILHGAGYETRYTNGLDSRLHGMYSDDYIATEALTGHPAMVRSPFARDVVRKYWLLHGLMRALALHRIERVEFDGLHRQHVVWDNGEVWVNRGESDWSAAGHTLPQYGFYARVDQVEAAIERRQGLIVEWSRSADGDYVNARPVVSDRLGLRVRVDDVRPLAARRFELTLRWEVEGPVPAGARIFVHFTDAAGKILFQGDHNAPAWTPGTVRTTVAVNVPEGLDGEVQVRAGLYQPGTGTRYLPEGPDDGTRQYIRLGSLNLAGFAFTPYVAPPDLLLARLNPENRIVAFDAAATNGAFLLAGEVLTPLPGGPAFEIRLRGAAVPQAIEALDEQGNTLSTLEPRVDNGEVMWARDPAVFAYRMKYPQRP